jgi:DnaJ-class molecular chaperone
MKKPSAKHPSTNSTEIKCPECDGTGFAPVKQPVQPGRKIYPAPCKKCGGKGRIPAKDGATFTG